MNNQEQNRDALIAHVQALAQFLPQIKHQMSAFLDDHAEDMNNPEYAYEFGRNERELEIIKLLEAESPCQMKGMHHDIGFCSCQAIALIKGEK